MQVKWNTAVRNVGVVYFSHLSVNETFRINTNRARGAVYIKVINDRDDEEFMLELETGRLFEPTNSPVERVNVEVNVDAPKPQL